LKRLGIDGLRDRATLVDRLAAAGLSQQAADQKADIFRRCVESLLRMGGQAGDVHALFVPGRIEVLGKHTDYAGGRSLLAAVERGFCVVARARDDNRVRIAPVDQEAVEFDISPRLVPAIGSWSNYPMTVARRLARNFPIHLRGAEAAFASDLPAAAGMSSSSALVVASFLVLSALNELHRLDQYRRNITSREDLAGYLGTIENGQSFRHLAGDRGVGTFGGSEDHTAMLCCRPETLVQYAFRPVRWERNMEFPAAFSLAVGCSGVQAEKTGSAMEAYNRASALASAVLQAWNEATGRSDPSLAAALASSVEAPQRLRESLQSRQTGPFSRSQLVGRLEQFQAESNEIIPAAGDALTRGDLSEFGGLVDRSQELAERHLGNQVPNTVFLARSARELGAAAASAFGAGFGGAVWAMVPAEASELFLAQWAQRYRQAFSEAADQSSFFLTRPGPAAFSPTGLEW
jgi:galactokinase